MRILVSIFCCSVSCYGKNLNSSVMDVPPGRYDRTSDFIDRTLYIEYVSKNYRGNWLRMLSNNYQAYIFPTPEDYIFVDQYIRLQAMDCGEETICLRNRFSEFVDADNNFWCLSSKPVDTDAVFASSPAPQYYNDFKWKVYCTSPENTDSCYICDITQTALNSEWICLYVKSNKYVAGSSLSVQEHNWRIVTHKASDNGYSVGHFDLCNDLEAAVYMNYQYCVGIEVPLFSGWTVSPSLALEIKEAIQMDVIRDGSSHANEWSNEMYNYQTWNEENCTIIEVPIPPRSSVSVQQLTAEYGPFLVKSQRLNIVETELTNSCNEKN